ncbi:hypothetical protein LINGRAHAP2_LOCUS2613 [Linum grandiflorum]
MLLRLPLLLRLPPSFHLLPSVFSHFFLLPLVGAAPLALQRIPGDQKGQGVVRDRRRSQVEDLHPQIQQEPQRRILE